MNKFIYKYTLVTCFDNDIHLTNKNVGFSNPIRSGEQVIFDGNKFIVDEVIHRHDEPDETLLSVTPSPGNWVYPPLEEPIK